MTGRVYRCYDALGTLLYVGSTMNPVDMRLQQHRRLFATKGKSAWVVDLARVEVDEYPSWQAANLAESALIEAFRPPGNTQIGLAGARRSFLDLIADQDAQIARMMTWGTAPSARAGGAA